jgi:paraquat-inducible protein A
MMNLSDQTRLNLSRALVVTGLILYIPSNIMPVMTMSLVGKVDPLTVMRGVLELYDSGLPLIAGVVFLASFVLPFAKLAALAWVLFLHGSPSLRRERSKVFKIVHRIGSWSMIDIFLLAVLAAVGQLGALASVRAEPGCIVFAIVLLCSLVAAEIYKPRLIWEDA